MTGSDRGERVGRQEVFLATLAVIMFMGIVAAGVWVSHENAVKQQRFQTACIEAGGTYAQDVCVSPRGGLVPASGAAPTPTPTPVPAPS